MGEAQRAIIDAIESMGPSTVYVEADEQGRARVVRLERAPHLRAVEAGEAESIAAAVEGACAKMHGPAVLSPHAREAIERCVDTIRDVVALRGESDQQRLVDRISRLGGVLTTEQAREREAARNRRENDAWSMIRPALATLIGEVAPDQVSSLDTSEVSR